MAEIKQKTASGKILGLAGALCCGLIPLAGCGGPTYGTDKSSGKQLVDDLSNITKWGSLSDNKNVDMRPRPELVRPSAADLAQPLPMPQDPVAKSGGKDWPESPEERRARLRAEATANSKNPNYVSPIIQDDAPKGQRYLPTGIDRAAERENNMPSAATTKQQTERYKQLKAEQSPGTAKTRKYLSQPPLDYYQPSPNAPQGDLGETEDEKEQKKKSGKTSIFGK